MCLYVSESGCRTLLGDLLLIADPRQWSSGGRRSKQVESSEDKDRRSLY